MDTYIAPSRSARGNVTIVRPDLSGRKAAHWEYLERKFLATGRKGERWRVIEHCRAELTWSKLGRTGGNDGYYDGPHMSEIYRMPHEHAAARVIGCWNHLHPVEWRIRENLALLRSQINYAAIMPHGALRIETTRAHIRLLLGDRRKAVAAFFVAVAEYRRHRRALGTAADLGCEVLP